MNPKTLTQTANPFPPLKPRRGNLYTYQVVKSETLHEVPQTYSVDLGFSTRIDLELQGLENPTAGQLVEAVRTEKNSCGDRYRFQLSSAGTEILYTYKATLERVVDGDTLWLQVDLGFRVWTRQKIRLRGINTAEMSNGGIKAAGFVTRHLSRVPFVVAKFSSRDKFGRYLTDIFYLEGTEDTEKVLREGIYLNQELLDRGLAVRYEGD